ncbi:VOC family protein, partial [Escherichia coli]
RGVGDTPNDDHRPREPRWTHIAIRVRDIDASIDWYRTFTPLELLDKRSDEYGYGAWLGQPDSADRPFILV